MTSPENLGPQFADHIRVYRGLAGITADQALNSGKRLGIHWSNDDFIAKQFAGNDSRYTHGTLLTGLVHPDDVMTPEEIQKHNSEQPRKTIYHQEAKGTEREIPIRQGATVHITGAQDMSFYDEPQIEKEHNFTNPQAKKA